MLSVRVGHGWNRRALVIIPPSPDLELKDSIETKYVGVWLNRGLGAGHQQ